MAQADKSDSFTVAAVERLIIDLKPDGKLMKMSMGQDDVFFETSDSKILDSIQEFENKNKRNFVALMETTDKTGHLWMSTRGQNDNDLDVADIIIRLFKKDEDGYIVQCHIRNGNTLLAKDFINEIIQKFSPQKESAEKSDK